MRMVPLSAYFRMLRASSETAVISRARPATLNPICSARWPACMTACIRSTSSATCTRRPSRRWSIAVLWFSVRDCGFVQCVGAFFCAALQQPECVVQAEDGLQSVHAHVEIHEGGNDTWLESCQHGPGPHQ